MCTSCSKIISKSIKGLSMKNALKLKSPRSIKSADVMDAGIELGLVLIVFAAIRLLDKFAWYQKLGTGTKSTVQYGTIILGIATKLFAQNKYVQTVGITTALAGIYNKYGADVDSFVKQIFNIKGLPPIRGAHNMLSNGNGYYQGQKVPMVAGMPSLGCPSPQKITL
jgi:hypothetical protein